MSTQLTFVLNGEPEVVSGAGPTTTLLQYLRRDKRLTGTKEGCAEGDCGACTVIVGELHDGKVHYRPVNACIQFMPMLHGKSVRTVEGVAGPDGSLHRSQKAIVDLHGSQCGFCTPGFVASVYAMCCSDADLGLQSINDALAGNLCRCTGYGPLIAAAEHALTTPPADWEADRLAAERTLLDGLDGECEPVVGTDGARAYRPTSGDELAGIYRDNPDATIIAGATDVGLWVTKKHQTLPVTIHMSGVADLRSVTWIDGHLRIGAAATYADLMAEVTSAYPDFGELLRRLGAAQVRSAGTLCGNVANGSPIGDTPPALIALGAEIILRKGDDRRRLPVEDFFIAYGKQDRAPGEFVEAIEIPKLANPGQLKCYKISKRFDQDISAVCGCFNVTVENGRVKSARIAYGGMAATPLRARAVEKALIGQSWESATIDAATNAYANDFKPITDMRATASYRLLVAANLLKKYFHETRGPLSETRLVGHGATIA
jgi:xanthine dehydrogenase small subunit